MNYAQYAGSIANGLAVLGYNVSHATDDFANRCVPQSTCYNISDPSNWLDPTIVVPGLPPAHNSIP